MKLLLDEHYSSRIAEQLRAGGFDALAVTECAELRRMGDEDLLRWAHGQERVIVTENARDFLALHAQFLNAGDSHSGLLLASPRRFPRSASGIGRLVSTLVRVLDDHPDAAVMRSDIRWLQ